jgi:hypothetical protein
MGEYADNQIIQRASGAFNRMAESWDQTLREMSLGLRTVELQSLLEVVIEEHRRPSVLYRPALSIDGNQWCALYGANLQDGVAGFGDSPELAMWDFDKAWGTKLSAQQGSERKAGK